MLETGKILGQILARGDAIINDIPDDGRIYTIIKSDFSVIRSPGAEMYIEGSG